ncbi:MAG: hypothetical protein HY765_04860, partial [Rhodomicrobium sp.]|nr:hypothetical protein [Rhodomicrobium sp.]
MALLAGLGIVFVLSSAVDAHAQAVCSVGSAVGGVNLSTHTACGVNAVAYGDDSTSVGNFAGFGSSGLAQANQAFGKGAGGSVSGSWNNASGYSAGYSVSGSYNNASGTFAGEYVTGNNNNAMGPNAGLYVGGLRNNAIGNFAGRYVNGSDNIALGSNAGGGINNFNRLTASNTISIGTDAKAKYNNSIAFGYGV